LNDALLPLLIPCAVVLLIAWNAMRHG